MTPEKGARSISRMSSSSAMKSIIETAQCSEASRSKSASKGPQPRAAAISAIERPSKARFSGRCRLVARMFSKPTSREMFSKSEPVSILRRILARCSGSESAAVSASVPPAWNSGGRTWMSCVEPAG